MLRASRMIDGRTHVDVVRVTSATRLQSLRIHLAFEVSPVAVLVVLMTCQTAGSFTLVLAFLSVIVDMVTYVVIYMEMYEVHVVLRLTRPSARVATSLVRTLMFVDLLLLGS